MTMSLLSQGAEWDPHSHLDRPSLSVEMEQEMNRHGGNQQSSLNPKQIPVLGFEASPTQAFSGAECVGVGVEMEFSTAPKFLPPGGEGSVGGLDEGSGLY